MNFACISDTHGKHKSIVIPYNIDCIIHSGDFSDDKKTFDDFINWFSNLNIKHKIIISGNHEIYIVKNREEAMESFKKYNIIYLEDSFTIINDIKIYGSPWTTKIGNQPFTKDEDFLNTMWKLIPNDIDILITHGPAYDTLDMIYGDKKIGSKTLFKRKKELFNLKYHIFGHIHEDSGILEKDNVININACSFNFFTGIQKPFVFSI